MPATGEPAGKNPGATGYFRLATCRAMHDPPKPRTQAARFLRGMPQARLPVKSPDVDIPGPAS